MKITATAYKIRNELVVLPYVAIIPPDRTVAWAFLCWAGFIRIP